MTPLQLVALGGIVAVGAATQTAIGFGAMVIAVTLGAWVVPVEQVVPTLIPVTLAQTAWVALHDRHGIAWSLLLRRVLPLMGLGMFPALLLVRSDAPWMRPLLGATILALALRELLRVGTAPPSPSWSNVGIVASGVVHGLFATGGPVLVWALGRETLDKQAFRATLTAVWLLLNVVLAATLVADGRIHAGSAVDSARLLPAVAAGIALGQWLHVRVDEARFRRTVWQALAGASLPLLFG